jgi:hypothetical protein
VGEDVVDVGGMRPTTSAPAVAVPEDVGGAMDGYLDLLGIEQRHTHRGPRLCLVDLPDTDSVVVEHRHRVDAMLPLVDVVVWVTDPEKYSDARLHREYVTPMAGYSDQLLFVLNQADRLAPDRVGDLVEDFTLGIVADGVDKPTVLAVSASPASGPPIGIDELLAALEAKRGVRDVLFGKLLVDLAGVSRELSEAAGSSVDFDRRGAEVVKRSASQMIGGDTEQASAGLTSFLDAVRVDTGGPTGDEVERLTIDVPRHVARIAAEMAPVPARRRRFGRVTFERGPDTAVVERLLVEAVIRPVRVAIARRALALASIAELAVEAESMRGIPPR